MKTLLLSLLVLGTISAQAGTLSNTDTGETISFHLDGSNHLLTINSSARSVESKIVALKTIDKENSKMKLFGVTAGVIELAHSVGEQESDEVVSYGPYLLVPVTAVIDIALLPIKLPLKKLKDERNQKDFNELLKAISTNQDVVVTDKRFQRIVKLL